MAMFPFTGWDESFYGDLHIQGREGVQFYTQQKVVIDALVWRRRRRRVEEMTNFECRRNRSPIHLDRGLVIRH